MSFSLEGATVLVTGGAGLVGSHVIDQLVGLGAGEIRVLDNLTRGSRKNLAAAEARRPLVFIEADVRDRSAVRAAVAGCDYVFHQAAIRITRCAEQPRECLEVLVGGTFNVFEAAVQEKVKKVVYASSASVYGAAEEFPTGEWHHPYNNRTLYGAAKAMNEGIARSFHDMYGLPSVGLRYFNVYGPSSSAGWTASTRAPRPRSTATAAPRWTSSTSKTSRGPTCWRCARSGRTPFTTSPAARRRRSWACGGPSSG
jgi:UDP-glucose 4-epimerase